VVLVDEGGEEEEEEAAEEDEEGEEEGSGDGWGKVAINCYKSCNKQQQEKQFVISFRNGASVGAFLLLLLPSHMFSPAHLWLRIHLPFARIACPLMDPILITLPPKWTLASFSFL
jgi:hypothetical protein